MGKIKWVWFRLLSGQITPETYPETDLYVIGFRVYSRAAEREEARHGEEHANGGPLVEAWNNTIIIPGHAGNRGSLKLRNEHHDWALGVADILGGGSPGGGKLAGAKVRASLDHRGAQLLAGGGDGFCHGGVHKLAVNQSSSDERVHGVLIRHKAIGFYLEAKLDAVEQLLAGTQGNLGALAQKLADQDTLVVLDLWLVEETWVSRTR